MAGIFRAHGVWVGTTFKGTEYENHENHHIKEFLKSNWKFTPGIPMEDADKADLYHFCETLINHDDPWMMKVAIEYYPIFDYWFPNMNPVLVYRNREKAIEGLVKRKGEHTREAMTEHVNARYDYMDDVAVANGMAMPLSSDSIIEGDYDGIDEVLSRYDIEFDENEAVKTLKPRMFTR